MLVDRPRQRPDEAAMTYTAQQGLLRFDIFEALVALDLVRGRIERGDADDVNLVELQQSLASIRYVKRKSGDIERTLANLITERKAAT